MPTSYAELLKRLQYLTLVARRSGRPSLITGRRAPLSAGVRDYAPGDDYRHIDWHRCAKHDELMTRTFDPFCDRPVFVLLDCSPSMEAGRPGKLDVARRITAAIGYLAVQDLSRFSVTIFADGLLGDGPTIRHESSLGKLLRFLDQLSVKGSGTHLTQTAERFVRRNQRPGPVVVISDLYDRGGFRQGFDILQGHGYQPRLVQIIDPAEAKPTILGDVELVDSESGVGHRATVTERAAARYAKIHRTFLDSVRDYCSRRTIPCMQIGTDMPEESVLAQVLGGKAIGTDSVTEAG